MKLTYKENAIVKIIKIREKFVKIHKDAFSDLLFDVVHCTTRHHYSQANKTVFRYETFDEDLDGRDISIMVESMNGLNLTPIIKPIYAFGFVDTTHLNHVVVFKHPLTKTWFYVRDMSVRSNCDSCEGDNESEISVNEEKTLEKLFTLHFTNDERLELFGDANYLC